MFRKSDISFFSLASMLYIFSLLFVAKLFFREYGSPTIIIVYQVFWTIFTFFGLYIFYHSLKNLREKKIFANLLLFSLIFRIIVVFFFYNLFNSINGEPFEYLYSDHMWYDKTGEYLSEFISEGKFFLLDYFNRDFSDYGYPYFLALVYALFGHNIIIARLVQTVISSFSVVLVYKITDRLTNKNTALMAGLLMMLSSAFIRFSAIHLKETLFVFNILFGTYHAIILFLNPKLNIYRLVVILLSYFSLFAFRTSTGIIFMVSFLVFLFLQKNKQNLILRFTMIPLSIIAMLYIVNLSPASDELEGALERGEDYSEQVVEISDSQDFRALSGLPFNLALSLTGPFPNLTDNIPIEQDRLFAQQILSIDIIIKNIFSFFYVLGLYFLFKDGFRKNIFILSIVILNLIIMAYTGTILNFRHYLPVYPFLIILTSIGIVNMNNNFKKYFYYYLFVLLLVVIMLNALGLNDYGIYNY